VPSPPPDPPVREAAAPAPPVRPVPPASAPGEAAPKPPPPAQAPPAPAAAPREPAIEARQSKAAPSAVPAVPREPAVTARRSEAAPPVAVKPEAPPPLDLKSLEQRLKETNAIGVLTKLSLKNQVDDLLEQFREYYQGRLKTTLAELRRPYELLLMKALSLLQDGDPALAKAINASREAIWAILSDRDKFSKLA
jgi:hypothetical protein